MSELVKKVYQPLHPSIRGRLDPEYVTFHDEILQYVIPSELPSWNPSLRLIPSPLARGTPKLVEVGFVFDLDRGNFQLRVFVPEGATPDAGWPCLIWLHGGGWVMGGLNSENGFLRHVCKYLNCTVISINYRHAPEHTYPTAIEDAFDGVRYILSPDIISLLHLDDSRLALGGLSAGGNLAAILSMKAALEHENLQHRICFQLLICPVIDNTASTSSIWKDSQYAPWLTPSRMTWYRQHYFPNPIDTKRWDASPCFAPQEVVSQSPKTFLAVAECDLLAPEALRYAEQLRQNGVPTELHVYKGATHSILVLAGIHRIGKKLTHDACLALAAVFGIPYRPSEAPIITPHLR